MIIAQIYTDNINYHHENDHYIKIKNYNNYNYQMTMITLIVIYETNI